MDFSNVTPTDLSREQRERERERESEAEVVLMKQDRPVGRLGISQTPQYLGHIPIHLLMLEGQLHVYLHSCKVNSLIPCTKIETVKWSAELLKHSVQLIVCMAINAASF